jgi:hypothetical protein
MMIPRLTVSPLVVSSVFVTAFALHPTGRLQPCTAQQRALQAPARERARRPPIPVVAGHARRRDRLRRHPTSLTGFLADTGDGDRPGLL